MTDKSPYPPTIRIGILVYEGFEPIDVWGFTEAFAISRFLGTAYENPPQYPFEILLISNEVKPAGKATTPAPVKSSNGPRVAPDMFRNQALSERFDLLMIPGGNAEYLLEGDPKTVQALIDWVKAMDKRVKLMTSVCTGAAVLAHAGVL
jgi:putative intracellular protease/amidase